MSIINAKLCFVQIIVKCFLKQFRKANIFKNVKIHFFFSCFKSKIALLYYFSVKKCILGIATGSKAKRSFWIYGTFPCVADSFFVEKKQKPSQKIKKCPKNRVLFLEQFRLSRTISTPLEFSKISFFQKMSFSWFALYLDPTDW